MPTPCIFCDKNSGSREHMWPAWIHRLLGKKAIRHKVGSGPLKQLPNAEVKVRTVCGNCNGGWMSRLEVAATPTVGAMLQDIATPLDEEQQKTIAAWAVKTAMVFDSIKGRQSPDVFYTREECLAMHERLEIPNRTRVFIGRIDGSHLGAYGTDLGKLTTDGSPSGKGMAFTLIVGHLVIQVVTIHNAEAFKDVEITGVETKGENWDEVLMSIWPEERTAAVWPPKSTFTLSGQNNIEHLMDRWRIGNKVS